MADVLTFLRGVRLFSQVDERVLAELATRCTASRVAPDYVLYRTGEPCAGLFVIESGEIRLFHVTAQGRLEVVGSMGPGETPGALAFLRRSAHTTSASAHTTAQLLFLPYLDFARIRHAHPHLHVVMTRALAEHIERRSPSSGVSPLDHISARLGQVLLGLVDRARLDGAIPPDATNIEIDVGTPLQLVRKVGAPKKYLTSALQSLERLGLIEPLPDGRLRIPSLQQLQMNVELSHRIT